MEITKEQAKVMSTQELWTLITDIARTMKDREGISDTDKSKAYKDITLKWYSMFQTLVCEADDRLVGQVD